MIKKIIHLSDLHFGTERPGVVDLLIKDCLQMNADMIVVSGDLTQRAKHDQYAAVKKFLENFRDKPILCVPGNHDISLYNLAERFFYPFSKYKKWVSSSLCCEYSFSNLAILGVNSVTPFKVMSGYITDKQLKLVNEYFKRQPEEKTRIVVMHHNLISSERHKIINDSDKILEVFANARVDMILSGHIHYACIESIKKKFISNPMYVITAGTAISYRTSAPNSYNVIELNNENFMLTVRALENNAFVSSEPTVYHLK